MSHHPNSSRSVITSRKKCETRVNKGRNKQPTIEDMLTLFNDAGKKCFKRTLDRMCFQGDKLKNMLYFNQHENSQSYSTT
jgi:hypothetical protein